MNAIPWRNAESLNGLGSIGNQVDAHSWLATLFVAALAAALLFPSLDYPLLEPDEGRYAEIAREMVQTNEWIVPQLNYEPYLDKPPLFYWLVALSYQAFGVSERSARLVPTLAAWLTVLLVHCWGRAVLGPRTGLLAAIVLASCAGFVQCSRILILDSLLTLWVTGALCAGYLACRSPRLRWRWWLVTAICCALGVMTKGPVAMVLVAPPLAAWGWLTRRRLYPTVTAWLALLGGVLALAAPWHLAMIWRIPPFAEYFFLRHHVDRFMEGTFHAKPFWFYLPVLVVGGLPWSLLTPAMIASAWRARKERNEPAFSVLTFLGIAATWCVAFFTLSRGKLPSYVLPVAPLASVVLGWWLTRTWQTGFASARVSAAVLAIALLGVLGWAHHQGMALAPLVLAELATVAVIGTWLAWRRARPVWTGCALIAIGAVHFVSQALVPAYALQRSPWARDQAMLATLSEQHVAVACYGREWGSLPFYLDRNDVANFTRSEWTDLRAYLGERRTTYVITKRSESLATMNWCLQPGATMTPVAAMGDVNVFRVETPEGGVASR